MGKVLLQRQSNPPKHGARRPTTPRSPAVPTSPFPIIPPRTTSVGDVEPEEEVQKADGIKPASEDGDDDEKDISFFSMDRNAKLTLISLAIVDFTSYLSMSIIAPFFPKTVSSIHYTDMFYFCF